MTHVNLKEHKTSGIGRRHATIEVWPGEGEVHPSLPFLTNGTSFEDANGVDWVVHKAILSEQRNRYFEEDGKPEFTYSYRYEASANSE